MAGLGCSVGGREPGGVEGVFVRLRLLIKTSLCSDVPLPVLMRIKKPKRVCVWLRSLRVWVCACEYTEVLAGVKCVCTCVQCLSFGVHVRVHVCVHALLFVCKSSSAPSTRRGINSLWLKEN